MMEIKQILDDIYNKFNIPFKLEIEDNEEYTSNQFNESCSYVDKKFVFNKAECCIRVDATFSNTIDLLIYCIENSLKEVFALKKDILKLLIDGKDVNKDLINNVWPVINSEFNLICIYVERNYDDIFSLIKESYLNSGIDVFGKNNNIVLIGTFEDIYEHTQSIEESIEQCYTTKFYISYCEVEDYNSIKNKYEASQYKIELAKKYNLTENIFDEKKLLFEIVIDSVSENNKEMIYEKFNEGFSKLDSEMIKTIDVFLKSGLNLSDAARELYIHRNTLIYRLDKIQKYTSYDIREFNNAVLFKVVFFLWKQKNSSQKK